MPLVDSSVLLNVADRSAYQFNQIQVVCSEVAEEGNGYYFDIVTATDDSDVEIPTEATYQAVDDDFEVAKVVKYGTNLPSIIGGMNAHFSRRDENGDYLQVGGWDGYLNDKDVRVSYYFAQLFYISTGYYMNATNVFSETVDEFAQLEVSTGPVIDFTDGVSYGNGNALNPANGTYFAATQLKIVVTSMGGTDLDIRLSVKDISDNPTTIDVMVPGGSIPGAEISIGTSSDRFLDVIGADFVPAGSTGTVGDDIKVINVKEREIAL